MHSKPLRLEPLKFNSNIKPSVVDVDIKKEDIIPEIEIPESTLSKYSEEIGMQNLMNNQSIQSDQDMTKYVVAVETTNDGEVPGIAL